MAQPQQTYVLQLRVNIRPEGNFGQGLEVSEEVTVRAETFLEIATILSRFHELAQAMKAAK